MRAYGAANPRFPFDDFIAGAVRPRDGTVELVSFSDLDRCKRGELQSPIDIRAFHDVVLAEGNLPLLTLRQRVEGWIGAQLAK